MKKFSLFLILSFVTVCASAQLMWKITAPDGSARPSYVFGTHHGVDGSFADRFGFDEIINNVDVVYGELSLDDFNDQSGVAMKMASMVTAPADSTLSKVFTAGELQEIEDALVAVVPGMQKGMIGMMDAVNPAAISLTLTQALLLKAIPDFDPNNQVDRTILARAAAGGRPVKGLETVERQLTALFSQPISEQAEELLKTVRKPNYGEDQLKELTRAYMANDLDAIAKVIEEDMPNDENESNDLIVKRNEEWLKILIGLLPTSSALIVVGVGHLPGDKGLLRLLGDAGFSVEPVNVEK